MSDVGIIYYQYNKQILPSHVIYANVLQMVIVPKSYENLYEYFKIQSVIPFQCYSSTEWNTQSI